MKESSPQKQDKEMRKRIDESNCFQSFLHAFSLASIIFNTNTDRLSHFELLLYTVLPECLPLYHNVNEFRNKRVLIADIGSLNISFLEANNLVPQIDTMLTATFGINILKEKMSETLTTEYGISFFDDDINQILKTNVFILMVRNKKVAHN
jgi:hypothetical protein